MNVDCDESIDANSMVFDDDNQDTVEDGVNDNSSDDVSSSMGNDSSRNRNKMKREIAQMGTFVATENKQVYRWRLLVITSILLVGAFVSIFTFWILKQNENASATEAVRDK